VKPVVAVGAIVWDDDRLLVVRRGTPPSEGLWTVPGGKLEFGERLEAAVVREVREETGLDVTCGALSAVVERSGEDWHYVILDYLATVHGGTLRPGDDVTDARWVTFAELGALPHTEGLLEIIERSRG
jgi:8-oxo-dGTP diphosphatase